MSATDTPLSTMHRSPHPYIQQPILYISNLPSTITDIELANVFESCRPFKPTIPRESAIQGGYVNGTIEFKLIDTAEKALATLQSRQIPGHPLGTVLTLSPVPPTNPPTVLLGPSAAPRLVKQLPPGFTDYQLYDLFRPYGPMYSARTQPQTNVYNASDDSGTGIVEFYREEDAKKAEEELHCAEVGDRNIAVTVYHQPRRTNTTSEISAHAPPFIPSGYGIGINPYAQYSPPPPQRVYSAAGTYSPPQPYAQGVPRSPAQSQIGIQGQAPFVHGPGQQVQFAPLQGPGSGSHSGLIDPCNLFCKNLDPEIDSNALFSHFKPFGQIVSARVMRTDSGQSRGFGFVSYQTPDQAAAALHAMNGIILGSKQLVVRLHEPKQLRQEKLAQRFAQGGVGHNGHPRSRSGATSPAGSEGGESLAGGMSPGRGYVGLGIAMGSPVGSQLGEQRARRSSGSYYNAALAGHLNMSLNFEDLSTLSPVVRKEVLTGELQRRVKDSMLDLVAENDLENIVDRIVSMNLEDVVKSLEDKETLRGLIGAAKAESTGGNGGGAPDKSPSPANSASQESRLLNAAASAPEHPSTPVSITPSLSTPPRTESPAGAGTAISSAPSGSGSEKERIHAAVSRLEPENGRAKMITELIMGLSKRERAMCLFNVEVLRVKVEDAKAVLDSDEDAGDVSVTSTVVNEPVTPAKKVVTEQEETSQTPELSSKEASAATSPAAPSTPPTITSATTQPSQKHTAPSLARLPALEIISIVSSTSASDLPFPKADSLVVKATDEFIDSLKGLTIPQQKQQVGDKLFRIVKAFGVKGAPKVTIALLDQDDLRALAQLMNGYPSVLKEKALLVQAATAAK